MSVIEKNGLKLNIEIVDKTLKYKVLSQTPEATDIIKLLGGIKDEETGYGMRSNLYPAWTPKKKIFYIRGNKSDRKNEEVVVKFASKTEAEKAAEAIGRMAEKIILPEGVQKLEHKKDGQFKEGGTSDLRTAIISKNMAVHLRLTGKDYYPEVRTWRGGVVPLITTNFHYSDHLSQAIDVLNKATSRTYKNPKDAVGANLHKVTHDQASRALNCLRSYFDIAEIEGYLVAAWRLVTGLRSSDVVEEPFVLTAKQFKECLDMLKCDVEKIHPGAIYEEDSWSVEMDKTHMTMNAKFRVGKEIKSLQKLFQFGN